MTEKAAFLWFLRSTEEKKLPEVEVPSFPSFLRERIEVVKTPETEVVLVPSPGFRKKIEEIVKSYAALNIQNLEGVTSNPLLLSFLESFTVDLDPTTKERILHSFVQRWIGDRGLSFGFRTKLRKPISFFISEEIPRGGFIENRLTRIHFDPYDLGYVLKTQPKRLPGLISSALISRAYTAIPVDDLPAKIQNLYNKSEGSYGITYKGSRVNLSLLPIDKIDRDIYFVSFIVENKTGAPGRYIVVPAFLTHEGLEQLKTVYREAVKRFQDGTLKIKEDKFADLLLEDFIRAVSGFGVEAGGLRKGRGILLSDLLSSLYIVLQIGLKQRKQPPATYEDFIETLRSNKDLLYELVGHGVADKIVEELNKKDSRLLRFLWSEFI